MSNSTPCPFRLASANSLATPELVRAYVSRPSLESETDESDSFVRRERSRLVVTSARKPFRIVGPNIYWLGTDENVGPSVTFPSSQRVLDALATAAAMGATTVRSTTLGVSLGTKNALEPSLGIFNTEALDHLGFVVYTARLSIPETNKSAFYDTNSVVYQDFSQYFTKILNHTNPYTQIKLSQDPTIMIWETGNELEDPDPIWTRSVSNAIKNLAPNQLVGSGRYGVDLNDLLVDSVDLVTDHFYPPSSKRYRSGLNLATHYSKAYFVGEFDWTGKTHDWTLVLAIIVPGLVAFGIIHWLMTAKNFFPLYIPIHRNRKVRILERWQALLGFMLFSAVILGGVGYWVGIGWDQLEGFLRAMEDSSDANGGLFWSLFGRDDGCCSFVQHNDGFTLHYPGQTEPERRRVSRLVNHAARVAGRLKFGTTEQASWVDVACPQIGWKNGTGGVWGRW